VIRVILSGATGKVGAGLAPVLAAEPDIDLVARVAPSLGLDLPRALAEHPADVVVDFTVPEFAAPACEAAIAAGAHVVLGTSGLPDGDRERLQSAAAAAGVTVFHAPNFAIGAVLMMRFAAQAQEHLPDCQIIELHADSKRDAPSGTALATAALLHGDVPIASVRLPGLVAHQEVIFGGLGETLTIRHDTTSRESFAPGVLLAVRRIGELPAGFVTGLDVIL
jgi:4-hydroxy-tetrahydrodipicolinate reductase